jgi:uncharacterized protein YoxC
MINLFTATTSSDLEGSTIALVLVAIIAICVILCIVRIYNVVQEIRDNTNHKLEQMQKDLHRIADAVASKNKDNK